MKKAFLIVTAVLLALAVVSCENPANQTGNSKPKVYYDGNGRASIDLDIGIDVGNSRGLHKTLAEAGTDFYEVIFVSDTGKISRTNWRDGLKVAKLRVDLGTTGINYNNPASAAANFGYAYIFAGRYSDKTLLGVGKIKQVYNDATPASPVALITTASTKVIFEVTPLETNVNFDGPLDSNPSSFQYVDFLPSNEVTFDGVPVPAYQILADDTTDATFTLSNIAAIQTDGLDKAIKATTGAEGGFKPYIWSEGDIKPIGLTSVNVTVTPDAVITWPIDLEIVSNDSLGSEPGLCLIYFDIPVYLLNNTAVDSSTDLFAGLLPITWHFKGGLNNKMLDMGYDSMSLGGAILICVGDLEGGPGSLEIGAVWKP